MLLNVQELCVSYLTKKTELKAVDHVSFGIERGDTLGIIGESGSGKSTIVMAMLRQLDPRFSKITGRVEFDGQELLTLPDAEFKKLLWKRIAIVFQKSMNSLSPVTVWAVSSRIFTGCMSPTPPEPRFMTGRRSCSSWSICRNECTGCTPTSCPAA